MPPYVSPLRESQAAQTRHRILDAAAALFAERGFGATSLAEIARAAGVSTETVKQSGAKASLLLAAFDRVFSGGEGDGPIHERSVGAGLEASPTEELTSALVSFVVGANARSARLWPRLLDTAAGDPAFAVRLDALQASRRSDFLRAIAVLRERGLCRRSEPDDVLAAALSFLVSPEGYTQLVLESGWTEAAYADWLLESMRRLILEP